MPLEALTLEALPLEALPLEALPLETPASAPVLMMMLGLITMLLVEPRLLPLITMLLVNPRLLRLITSPRLMRLITMKAVWRSSSAAMLKKRVLKTPGRKGPAPVRRVWWWRRRWPV